MLSLGTDALPARAAKMQNAGFTRLPLAARSYLWQNLTRMLFITDTLGRRGAPAHRHFAAIISVSLVSFWVAICLVGCSPTENSAPKPAPPSGGTNAQLPALSAAPASLAGPLVRLHWLGKKRLAAEANATNFMAIWNLPESARLEAQTLDKLATAPWRLLPDVTPLSNAPTALLRPVLDDLVQEECYLEVAGGTNGPTEVALAVRLPAERAALWQSNLPVVFRSLISSNAVCSTAATNFCLQTADLSLQLSRAEDWTLFSALRGSPLQTSTVDSSLLVAFRSRLATKHTPSLDSATQNWIEVDVDLVRLNGFREFDRESPSTLPRLSLAIKAEAGLLRTTGALVFPATLSRKLEGWNIPTNIIHDPLVSFTAVRGAAPWLRAWLDWAEPQLGPAPDQFFFWAQSPALWQHFLTYPVANGSNHVAVVGDHIVRELNPLFRTNRVGHFDWATNTHALVWKGLPYFVPRIESVPAHGKDYVVAGLFANNATNQPMPAELFAEFQNNSNLVYFDWEISPPQVASWTQMSQLLRLVFGRAQLSPQTASLPWLRALTPRLGNATTVATLAESNRITFRRSSTCGLTAIELHLLADWLESPQFPCGLRSQEEVRRVPPPGAASATNAPAPPAGP